MTAPANIFCFGEILNSQFLLPEKDSVLNQRFFTEGGISILVNSMPYEFNPPAVVQPDAPKRTIQFSLKQSRLSNRDIRKKESPKKECLRVGLFKTEKPTEENGCYRQYQYIPDYPVDNYTSLFVAGSGKSGLNKLLKSLSSRMKDISTFDSLTCFTKSCDGSSKSHLFLFLLSSLHQLKEVGKKLPSKTHRGVAVISSRSLANDTAFDLPRDTTYEFAVHKIYRYLEKTVGKYNQLKKKRTTNICKRRKNLKALKTKKTEYNNLSNRARDILNQAQTLPDSSKHSNNELKEASQLEKDAKELEIEITELESENSELLKENKHIRAELKNSSNTNNTHWLHSFRYVVVRLSNSGVVVFDINHFFSPEQKPKPTYSGQLIFDQKRPVPFREPAIGVSESYGYLYMSTFVQQWMNDYKSKEKKTYNSRSYNEKFILDTVAKANLACNFHFLRGFIQRENPETEKIDYVINFHDEWIPEKELEDSVNAALNLSSNATSPEFDILLQDLDSNQVITKIPYKEIEAPEIMWRGSTLNPALKASTDYDVREKILNGLNNIKDKNDKTLSVERKMLIYALTELNCKLNEIRTLFNDEELEYYKCILDSIKPYTEEPDKPKGSLVRYSKMGKLDLADRSEIEDYLFLQNLLTDYDQRTQEQKPISIGVFGPPGSGKSFGVKQLVESLNNSGAQFQKNALEFNLSQMISHNELIVAFHEIRNACLQDKIPLIFFDEFDAAVQGTPFYWLKYFLAPMQDSSFNIDGKTYNLGKAVFIFAGGVNQNFSEMNGRSRNAEFCQAKGPDFLSRLKGVLNIRGIDKQDSKEDQGMHIIKRAILLKSCLRDIVGKQPNLITPELAYAMLTVPTFKHGIRSMESIIKMSHISRGTPFCSSDLPPQAQLDIHVDARHFTSSFSN
ncbi:MAG: AAA family ATPase [Verrucomicrobiota bacterium]